MGTALVWFRRDLRLADNPALATAAARHCCIPVFIHNPMDEGNWAPGGAGRWWLHHSLQALARDLERRGSRLTVLHASDTIACLCRLALDTGAEAVYWNRLYDPLLVLRDREIKSRLRQQGVHAESFAASLLREPWEVRRQDGGHYRTFTPFWRTLQTLPPTAARSGPPDELTAPHAWPSGTTIPDLDLLPRTGWDRGFHDHWRPGEAGAAAQLVTFLKHRLVGYHDHRDRPALAGTSRLSPHLHWGEISPRRIHDQVTDLAGSHPGEDATAFLTELGWREFAHHLLYHFPEMPETPLDRRFRRFPWARDADTALRAWQRGATGIPIVDAGMRELRATGWMHNRTRMIAGSLLTKNLRVSWQQGEAWFWDTLVDADLASNSMGWQWIQGCGADAAPYFRIFNPIRQGERFDADGEYVRRWVPELAGLPAAHIHSPGTAPAAILDAAGIRLGRDYPRPVVDPAVSRREALAAYDQIRH